MVDRVIEFSGQHKFLVLSLAAVAALAGGHALSQTPLDVLPDLSDKQVIVYSRWDRSPDLVDAQVTYPIVSALLGTPRVKSVRGFSDFGSSFVYVIFDDDADLYWARSRTLEALSPVLPRLPEGVKTELGPDATGLGWVFQYVLLDRSGKYSMADLRTYQDWYLSYYLKAVPGVAEVASAGGFVRQYQVNVDPNRLRAYGISIQRVVDALRSSNRDVGGRVIESGGAEFMVRGLGFARSTADLEEILIGQTEDHTPIRIKDVARVAIGSDLRRGVTDLDGAGETVSGIVVMRQGQNALEVIDRVKAKLRQVEPTLPPGLRVVPIYDRSELIHRSIDNLRSTIFEVIITVALVIVIFLWHVPSAIVPLITIPLAILIAFLPLRPLGVGLNIMSLGGIAIAIGALVDAGIVVVEQTHKKLEEWGRTGRREDPAAVILGAVQQVGRPTFYTLLVIGVSFLPVLTLEAQEGRLFKPLVITKSLAMVIAAIFAITLDPALRLLFTRLAHFDFRPSWLCKAANTALVGVIHSEESHPISRWITRLYEPVVEWSLRNQRVVVASVLVLMAATIPVWLGLGSEFMPPLDEGALLYMPTTMPGISIGEAQRLLQTTDRILKQFPETDRVLGKAGRAETATDPAPLSMLETIVTLRPQSQWRRVPVWYSSWAPDWAKAIFRHVTPDHISREELISRMDEALKLPGVANAWSMPIRGRLDMLTTGFRTPVGVKIAGDKLEMIDRIGAEIASTLPAVRGTRGVFAERAGESYFVDFQWDRAALARSGLSMEEAQSAVQYAIGGENVTVILEGRERYPVNVRYLRDFRDNLDSLRQMLVTSMDGERHIPIGEVAEIRTVPGPSMLRNENGLLTGYVYVDVAGRDLEGYVDEASRVVREKVKTPQNYSISWSGQYEAIARVKQRLLLIVPLTLFCIALLLYLNTRSLPKTLIVLLAVPFSAIGAIWLVYLLGYHMSIAVWIGLIALLGVDAETGVFMLLYLDLAHDKARLEGRLSTPSELQKAVMEGAARRVRPKFMTVATMFLGLLPILWSNGSGSEVMKRIAAPMIGGIFTSFLLELLVYPAIYYAWKQRSAR